MMAPLIQSLDTSNCVSEEPCKDYSSLYKLHLSLQEKKKVSTVMQSGKSILNEINGEVWDKAFTSAIQSLTMKIYPHYKVTQELINYLLNGKTCIDIGLAEEFLWKLLLCVPTGLKSYNYYQPILCDHYIVLDDRKTKPQCLFSALIEGLAECLTAKTDSNQESDNLQLVQEKVNMVSEKVTFLETTKNHDTVLKNPFLEKTSRSIIYFSKLKECEKIKRCLIALKFVYNILETDFVSWVEAKRLKLFRQSRPLFSYILWHKEKNIGLITQEFQKILELYKLVSEPLNCNFQVKCLVNKLVILLGEVIRHTEDVEINNHSFFGKNTCNFSQEIAKIVYKQLIQENIRREIMKENSLIINLKPSWLRLLLCSQLLTLITGHQCAPELDAVYDVLEYVALGQNQSNLSPKGQDRQETVPNSTLYQEFKKNSKTILHQACQENDVEKVKELLTYPEMDLNATNGDGWTPLHLAAFEGNAAVVQELLLFCPESRVFQKGLDTKAPGPNGYTPLMCAVLEGHADVCQLLLEHSGSILLQDINKYHQTPVELSTTEKVTEVLTYYKENRVWSSHTHCNINFGVDFKQLVIRLCVEFIQAYLSTHQTWKIHKITKNQEKNTSLRKSFRQFRRRYKEDYERYEKDISKAIPNLRSLTPKLEQVQEFKKSKEIYIQMLSL